MYCHKCGTELAEGAGFCHKCGIKIQVETVSNSSASGKGSPAAISTSQHREMFCPQCNSTDIHPISETETNVSGGGYGVGKGFCGWILLGPVGLLCGLCGKKTTVRSKARLFWVCKTCGHKFRDAEDMKAEEKETTLAACVGVLLVSIVLYIAGNLFAENDMRFLGMPSWLYITLGVLGMFLGIAGGFGVAIQYTVDMDDWNSARAAMKNYSVTALVFCIAALLGGILFSIADIRFFWIPAWIYLLVGVLGTLISGVMLLIFWLMGLSEEEMTVIEEKYGPIFTKVTSRFKKK